MSLTVRLLIGLILVSLCSHTAYGDGVVRDGVGAIASGRGGANLAHADNGAIVLENPAAMVNIEGNGLAELGIDVLVTDLRFRDADNITGAHNNPSPLGHLAFVKKSPDGLWAYGLGAFAPAGFGAEYDLANPALAPVLGKTMYRYKSFGALGKIMPAAALRVTDRLSIGGNLGVAISHAELEGPFFLQTPTPTLLPSGTPTVLDLQATGAALAWGVGLQYELSESTMLGLSYTAETRMRLDGSAAITTNLGFGPLHSRFDADLRLKWPRSLGIGIKHDLCSHRRISCDVVWFNWADAFDELDLTLTGPTNPILASMTNQVTDRFPLRWQDSISVRVGYEHEIAESKTLRCGYVYHRNPVPDPFLTAFIPAVLEHAVSVGYEREYCSVTLNLAYQFSWGAAADGGASAIAGGDFMNSSVDASAHWGMMSFLWKW